MAREPASKDVVGPQNDDALNDALEDTFPASDPINTTMTGVGSPPDHAPGGTDPDADETDEDETDEDDTAALDEIEAAEAELQGDEDLNPDEEADPDLEESDDDVAQDAESGMLRRG